MVRKSTSILRGLAACIGGMVIMTASAAPPLPGAIFTTDANGVIVNGNTKYESKCGLTGVWLDGGPGPNAPPTAAGLPDGDYYFQVTDPSCKVLLSNDPVQDRCVTVKNGVIDNATCSVNPHNTMPSVDAGGGVVVELCAAPSIPFDDTPNNGGVYKAFMTQVGDFTGDPTQVDSEGWSPGNCHGFIPAASKTDNFKVNEKEPTFCIKFRKEILTDKGIVPGVGWQINITEPLGSVTSRFTGPDGNGELCGLVAGTYTVEEILKDGFFVVEAFVNGVSEGATTVVFATLKKGNGTNNGDVSVLFQNQECGRKCP